MAARGGSGGPCANHCEVRWQNVTLCCSALSLHLLASQLRDQLRNAENGFRGLVPPSAAAPAAPTETAAAETTFAETTGAAAAATAAAAAAAAAISVVLVGADGCCP